VSNLVGDDEPDLADAVGLERRERAEASRAATEEAERDRQRAAATARRSP